MRVLRRLETQHATMQMIVMGMTITRMKPATLTPTISPIGTPRSRPHTAERDNHCQWYSLSVRETIPVREEGLGMRLQL